MTGPYRSHWSYLFVFFKIHIDYKQTSILQHSKVVLGEAASLGTLLELGNRSLDVLKNLVQRPSPGQSISDSAALPGPYPTALGVKEGVVIVRWNLEEILLYL